MAIDFRFALEISFHVEWLEEAVYFEWLVQWAEHILVKFACFFNVH